MRLPLVISIIALAGCGGGASTDVSGPFTGVTYRFTVDQLQLPMQRTDFADDLNGDPRVDNQLGNITGALAGQKDLVTDIDDLLASGVLAPVIEITTDDPTLRNDPTVGVRFIGRDGEEAGQMGGALVDGVLTTNRTRTTRSPVSATLHLPLFPHADPLTLPAIGLEAELVADGGGFGCTLHGAFPAATDQMPAWAALAQMLSADPQGSPLLVGDLDKNHDGVISLDEFTKSGLVQNIMAPDVQLTDGHGTWKPLAQPDNGMKDSLSFGLFMHLSPCPSGRCQPAPTNLCADRVRDGDESDLDCGGASCLGCAGGAHCNVAADCQSRQCTGGVCAAPSCSDGVQDGGETGVDCGFGCGPCGDGGGCRSDVDCTSGYCSDDFLSIGVCKETLCTDGVRDNDESDVDCGGHCGHCARGKACESNSDCASNNCTTTCTNGSCSGTCS